MTSVFTLKSEDFLRTHNAAGIASLIQSPTILFSSRLSRIEKLVKIAQYYPFSLGKHLVAQANRIARKHVDSIPLLDEVSLTFGGKIIKPFVSEQEPGLILVKFEHELEKVAKLKRLHQLEKHYKILFLPSWYPFYSVALCILAARAQSSFFVMPALFNEKAICDAFAPNCQYLPFHSASWVRGDLYGPPSEKEIDILMVANFARFKRHWKLFQALADLPSNLKVVLAGIKMGDRTRDSLIHEAKLFGVENRFTIIEGASDHPAKRKEGMPTIRELLSKSKLFCALTFKEGSFTSVAESLMAGTPVAMYKNALIGTKAHINEQTGFFLNASHSLSSQLKDILTKAPQLNPQPWANANISAEANCKKLNETLKAWHVSHGLRWSLDIESFYCQHLDFRCFDDSAEDRLAHAYEDVKEYGLTLERK